jgi:hypothetical protein
MRMHGTGVGALAAHQLKNRKPVLIANNCLAFDQA